MAASRRAVITGIGAITPIGTRADGLWAGICRGHSAVHRISRFDPSPFRSQLAAEVESFDPLDYLDAHALRRTDRFAQLGLAAARQAVDDAGICLERLDRARAGVSLGSALGGIAYGEEQHGRYLQEGPRAIGTALAIAVYGGASGAQIAIDLDLRGPNLANSCSCASGAMAIGEAVRLVQRGDADVVLAGGVEAPLAPLTFGAFSVIKAMSVRNDDPSSASRPFDRSRDGFVMGEGAAIVIVEELGLAARRDARIYGELLGYGQSTDAYHMTAPRPGGSEAARAVRAALADARIPPESIGYVNAHATGTPLGDRAEALALQRVFGDGTGRVPVSGTKGLYGHALGASGAIEVAITALALTHGCLPGTANLRQADVDCPLTIIGPGSVHQEVDYALTTSFGFGGANAALVIGRSPV